MRNQILRRSSVGASAFPKASSQSLFPNNQALTIFLGYICLFVSSTLFISSAQRQKLKYNQFLLVLLAELVKLIACMTIYLRRDNGSFKSLLDDLNKNRKLFILYLIPACLYCLYNNLTFINLQLFDPTTYHCLMQFRIVLTAFIYQLLFRRRLTKSQWLSLVVLTIGCLIKQFGMLSNELKANNRIEQSMMEPQNPDISFEHSEDKSQHYTTLPMNASLFQRAQPKLINNLSQLTIRAFLLISLILLQMFCSCFAGVYNEFLLKDKSSALTADVILQNMYMYIDSILCNAIIYMTIRLPAQTKIHEDNQADNSLISNLYSILSNPLLTTILLNSAISGLVASIFLKKLNSILKTFASAIEVFAVALLSWILFGDLIDRYTMIALLLVSLALIVYSREPVSVEPPNRLNRDQDFELLPDNSDDDEETDIAQNYTDSNHEIDDNNVTIVVK